MNLNKLTVTSQLEKAVKANDSTVVCQSSLFLSRFEEMRLIKRGNSERAGTR